MSEFPRLDAARKQLIAMKRARFKSKVRQWATESVAAWGESLPLADALWLLPVDALAEAMEMACAESGAAPFEFTRRDADLFRHCRDAVVRHLAAGALIAEGFAPGSSPAAGRSGIHPDRWLPTMPMDWPRSSAGPDSAPITGIVVRRADDALATHQEEAATPDAPAPTKPRRGRPPGAGSMEKQDAPLVEEMHKLRKKSKMTMAVSAAADMVVNRAAGISERDSKVKRLVKRYNRKFAE